MKIYLTKREKALLRAVAEGTFERQTEFSGRELSSVAYSLETDGLVKVAWGEGATVTDIALTKYGDFYLGTNPKLRNPLIGDVDWETALIVLVFIFLGVLVLALIGFLVKSLFFK
ncbi:MAG: hypothetical protein LUC24_04600 [Bacteroidales bacterium]|nr:hypothetical protein [Bacteroidales bacterium]